MARTIVLLKLMTLITQVIHEIRTHRNQRNQFQLITLHIQNTEVNFYYYIIYIIYIIIIKFQNHFCERQSYKLKLMTLITVQKRMRRQADVHEKNKTDFGESPPLRFPKSKDTSCQPSST